MRVLSLLVLFSTLFLGSCRFMGFKRIHGNGNIVSRETNISGFNSVDVSGAVVVHLRQSNDNRARIETDENLMEYIEVFRRGNTLVVKSRTGVNLRPTKDVILYASAPVFREIEVSGASKIISDNTITGSGPLNVDASGASEIRMQVSVPELETKLSGSSTMHLTGQATRFAASASGASEVKCLDLITDDTHLELSGASNVQVTANKTLDVDASGASDVHYRGNAAVNQKTSGASSVRKL